MAFFKKNLRLFSPLDCFFLDSRSNFFNRFDFILFFLHQSKADSNLSFTIDIFTPLDPEAINNFFILIIVNTNVTESYFDISVIQ
ncbi:hypothetical protein ES708_34102 [subsurface metagenome]